MSDFIKNFLSPAWWIGVVVVGIALNLISSYLKNPLDRVLTLFSGKYARRSKKIRADRDARIEQFKQHPDIRLGGLTALVSCQWICIVYILMTIAMLTVAIWFSGIPSMPTWLVGTAMAVVVVPGAISMYFFNRAFDLANTLIAAHSSIWDKNLTSIGQNSSGSAGTNTAAKDYSD